MERSEKICVGAKLDDSFNVKDEEETRLRSRCLTFVTG